MVLQKKCLANELINQKIQHESRRTTHNKSKMDKSTKKREKTYCVYCVLCVYIKRNKIYFKKLPRGKTVKMERKLKEYRNKK